MIQYLLVVAPASIFYTVSIVLFHKYGGVNAAFTNGMSHFSRFVPTKSNVILENLKTEHDQVIGFILCRFPNCYIMYPVGPVYYCLGHPSNTILLCYLKFYVGFQKVISEPLKHCGIVDRQGHYWRSPYPNQTI